MKFRGWLNGKRVVEGDPNKVRKNEILLVRDNSTGKVKSIKERGEEGSLKDIIEGGGNVDNSDVVYIDYVALKAKFASYIDVNALLYSTTVKMSLSSFNTILDVSLTMAQEYIGRPEKLVVKALNKCNETYSENFPFLTYADIAKECPATKEEYEAQIFNME